MFLEVMVGKSEPVDTIKISASSISASKFSKDIITDDRLMELNFGDWELLKWDILMVRKDLLLI